jgi:phosphoribosylanthranilate isomerase
MAKDAMMAEDAGADAIGIVVCSNSPRNVPLETASEILGQLRPFTAGVLVTHTQSREELLSVLDLHPTAVQVSSPFIIPVRTGVKLLRVVQPGGIIPGDCDAVVIDESQGSGKLYSTGFAKTTVRESKVPVILAGGLTPDNVEDAIRAVRPYAVDVASGVEIRPGVKDPGLVSRFIRNAKGVPNAR